jgi:hypothetical protein
MDLLQSTATIALATSVSLLTWFGIRMRERAISRRTPPRDALDTVASWPPEAARVLTIDERQAYDLLRRAMPGFLVLAQVPLSRFIRVPSMHSYLDWLQRAGSLSADLLLCDAGSRVLAVIDIRSVDESPRGQRRHARMSRVLAAAGIQVQTWREGSLPALAEVRHALSPLLGNAKPGLRTTKPGGRVSLIPVADIAEVLAEGDRLAAESSLDPSKEPVSSAFFDELEVAGAR